MREGSYEDFLSRLSNRVANTLVINEITSFRKLLSHTAGQLLMKQRVGVFTLAEINEVLAHMKKPTIDECPNPDPFLIRIRMALTLVVKAESLPTAKQIAQATLEEIEREFGRDP